MTHNGIKIVGKQCDIAKTARLSAIQMRWSDAFVTSGPRQFHDSVGGPFAIALRPRGVGDSVPEPVTKVLRKPD